MKITASADALLNRIIDYAGLFPPASLSLDESICNFAEYRQTREQFLLSRFICPARLLIDLAPYHETIFQTGTPFVFSVLAGGGATSAEFFEQLQADLQKISAFRDAHGRRVVVDRLECRLPAQFSDSPSGPSLSEFFAECTNLLSSETEAGLRVAYELGRPADWRGAYTLLIDSLAAAATSHPSQLKLRCGGVEAADFPTCAELACVISACAAAGVSMKCTAGLHHPIRHFNAGVQTEMHGFINVFAAAALAFGGRFPEPRIAEMLEDQNAQNFIFGRTALRWQNQRLDVDAIARARSEFITSFGSCSFDEPREDLRRLGIL